MRSTRSAIIGILEGTELLWVELALDGDPKYVSPILLDNYNSYEDALSLVMAGDMRTLGPEPGMCDAYRRDGYDPEATTKRESMWTLSDFMADELIVKTILLRTDCGYLYLFDADSERWLFANHTGIVSMLIRHT
jgi:hypothetical protein